MAELYEWGEAELADGGTITKAEARAKIEEIAAKHGVEVPDEAWEALDIIFDHVDTDENGEIDAAEAKAAMEAYKGQNEHPPYPKPEEIEAWVVAELEKDGSITWEEVREGLLDWAEENGVEVPGAVWEALKKMFDHVDADGNGEVTADEIHAAMEACKKGGPEEEALIRISNFLQQKTKKRLMSFLELNKPKKSKLPPLTKEQAKEIEDAIKAELARDGSITWEEAKAGITAFAEKHGFELGKPQWDELKWIFDAVDQDNNGEVTEAEILAAIEWCQANPGKC